MGRLTLLLAFALLLPAGCERQPTGVRLRVALADRLEDARVAGVRANERFPPAAVRDDLLVQRGGSTVTFALPVPEGAALRGEARVRVAGAREADGRLRVQLRSADGATRALADEALVSGTRVRLAADLSSLAGELVALDFAVEVAEAAERVTVLWQGLALEGLEAPAPQAPTPLARGRYNILIILLDSLRADHIAPYGAPASLTPHLSRLADQGVTFTAARSTSSWTKPAVASLFTSRPPWGHGVLEHGHVLPDVLPYLPELLAGAGWRTVGISATAMFSAPFGYGRGFGDLYELWLNLDVRELEGPEARADLVWRHLIRPATDGDAPFFVYLHELDPHSPYEPPQAYTSAAARNYSGRRLPSHADAIARIREARDAYSDAEIAWLHEQYRGEVAAMDAYVGRLLGHLDASGHARDTLVVFVSDHGEEFNDHRSLGHAHTVHEEVVRVPLLMRLEGVLPAGVRHDETVDLLDVAPTLLDLLGLEAPGSMLGRSLLPLLAGGSLPARASLASSREPLSHGLVWDRWKLVRGPGEGYRLYDLAEDPGEHSDLWRQQPVVGEALRQMLARRLREETIHTKVVRQEIEDLAPDAREQLRELGYIE